MLAIVLLCPAAGRAGPVVFSAAGATPADIQATVDNFRAALGPLNPNAPGSLGAGRREINWDDPAIPDNLPANFFNQNVAPFAAGVVFSGPGTGFRVSRAAPPLRFGDIDPSYTAQFSTFSPERLFTPVDTVLTIVDFFVPGSGMLATVSGFGAVFTDVGIDQFTQIVYLDPNGLILGGQDSFAPVSPPGGLSFLGVFFDAGEQVSQVLILSGTTSLGPGVQDDVAAGGINDLVVMDNFIFGEPQAQPSATAVPEPASWLLLLGGGLGLTAARFRRRPTSA